MRKLKKSGELIDYLIRNRNSKLNKQKYVNINLIKK